MLSFKVLCGYVAQEYTPVLQAFVSSITRLRTRGGMEKELGKLLINAFYGRLAMTEDLVNFNLDASISAHPRTMPLSLQITKSSLKKARLKTNIAVAAAITAKARLKLYSSCQTVLKFGGRLLYCDTDSIFAAFPTHVNIEDQYLDKQLIFSSTNPKIQDAVFIQPKTYGLLYADNSSVIRIKGINVGEISFQDLKTKFYGGEPHIYLPTVNLCKKNLKLEHTHINKTINLQNYNKRL